MRGVGSDPDSGIQKNAVRAAGVSAMKSKSNTIFFLSCGYLTVTADACFWLSG